jgi:hypothetical protein
MRCNLYVRAYRLPLVSLRFSLLLGSSASFLVLDISSCGLNSFVGDVLECIRMRPLLAAFSLADQEPETA